MQTEHKMNDPEIREAIRILKEKRITIEQIEEVYKYYDYVESA